MLIKLCKVESVTEIRTNTVPCDKHMTHLGFPHPGLLRVGVLLQLHPGQDEVVGAQLQRLLAAHHDPSPTRSRVKGILSREKKIRCYRNSVREKVLSE